MTGAPTPRRVSCQRCLRPQAACLCALVRPTAHRTEVLVLQHPHEQRQAKNSVALLRLSLACCEVVVGERFAPTVLQALLRRPGRDTHLLYTDTPAAPAPPARRMTANTPLRLVVLDATWRKSLRMLLEHPALATMPRLANGLQPRAWCSCSASGRRRRPGTASRGATLLACPACQPIERASAMSRPGPEPV